MRKAVLLCMADRANDDGSSVYISKGRIADEIECARSTVVKVAQSLEEDGLIFAVGKRKGNHGYTVVYRLDVQRIHALASAFGKCSDHSTSAPDLLAGSDSDPEGEDGTFEVADHATLAEVQVSVSGGLSVRDTDKNRPYRTKDINQGKKEASRALSKREQAEYLRWCANRCRMKDPTTAARLELEAEALEAA